MKISKNKVSGVSWLHLPLREGVIPLEVVSSSFVPLRKEVKPRP